jgi:heat shock protein HslJ
VTGLNQLLEDATVEVTSTFQGRRRRRRVIGATLVVALVVSTGAVAMLRDASAPRSTQLTAETPVQTSRWSGRWIGFAFSAVGTGPPGEVEVTLHPDGTLLGFNGCGEITGTWSEISDERLSFEDVQSPTAGCEAAAATNARLLQRVLTEGAEVGRFDAMPDTMKLAAGADFVGFNRDVSFGTPTDPETTGEVLHLGDRYELIGDASVVAMTALPGETRTQRWRDPETSQEIYVSRTLGSFPFSARAMILSTTGATVTEVEINEHVGVLQSGAPGTASITWSPEEDITLSLRTSQSDPEAVLAMAEALRYERGRLRVEDLTAARSMRNTDLVRPAKLAATGEVNGVPWHFLVYEDESGTCSQLVVGYGASGTCGEPDEVVSATAPRVLGGQVVHGSAPDGAVTVRIEWDGSSVEVPTASVAGFNGRRYFGATVDGNAAIRRVIAVDSHGEELGRNEQISGGAIGSG